MITIEKYFADWCAPCKQLSPILDEVKEKYGDQIDIVNVDVDDPDNRQKVIDNEVRSVPTVIIFNGDEEYVRINGLSPKKEYIEIIESILN